jgi:hypothetical protein
MKNEAQLTAESLIISCLKEAYFRRVKQEKLGKTPKLTQEIDLLEMAIQDFQDVMNYEESNENSKGQEVPKGY